MTFAEHTLVCVLHALPVFWTTKRNMCKHEDRRNQGQELNSGLISSDWDFCPQL